MTTTIKLLQSHIDKAKEQRKTGMTYISDSCPVSIALTEHFHRPCWVGICNWGWLDENKSFQLPKNMQKVVAHFDFMEYDKLTPTEFEIELRD